MSAPSLAFVHGTGRCGSTLVHEVLSRHPDIGFVTNVTDRLAWPPLPGRVTAGLYRGLPPAWSRKGRLRLAPSEAYSALARTVSPLVVSPGRPLTADDASPWLAERFRAFFEHHSRAQGAPVFLHKFTGWPRIGFIEQAVPGARHVTVVRDGRAVASSLVQMPWWDDHRDPRVLQSLPAEDRARWQASGRSFVLLAGIVWRMEVAAHEHARAQVPAGRWLQVRYEDVLARPREEFARMLAFLGLGWDPVFERRFARQRFEAGRADAYRRDLRPDQVRLLDDVLGDQLQQQGYTI